MLTEVRRLSRRKCLLGGLGIVVFAGLASRLVHSGVPLLDKYAGDALYAVMFYLLAALAFVRSKPRTLALGAGLFMFQLELFQLTDIPRTMVISGSPGWKLVGRLLGTTFSWRDMAAYAVGIGAVLATDRFLTRKRPHEKSRSG